MISQAQAHDLETQQIWAEFGARLRVFIRRRVASDADADDILQEVFLRIHRHAGTLQQRERLVSWLFQITRNVIADYYRAPARRRELSAGTPRDLDLAAEQSETWSEESDEASMAARRELAICLTPMVARLPPHYRDALTLVDLEGLTQKDAAGHAGLSLSGMKSRVQRGRQALEQLMRACCRIDIDAAGRVTGYQVRGPGCGGSCAQGCDPI